MKVIFTGKWIPGHPKLFHLLPNLSREARLRLAWMDYCQKHGLNTSLTCRRFGISRKTFYKWLRRYNKYYLASLKSHDITPINKRQREITPEQEVRIIKLRKRYIRYGKEKK